MARKPRVHFPGACYHVISRGNQRQRLFHDDADHAAYLERLAHYQQRYEVTLYAYVLMPNHVHLLLETGTTPLAKVMQGLQFTYTRYYNRRYRKVGHLFQGRYHAILCDRDAYLLELVRYIHLNPARLHPGFDPTQYRWSSHPAYVGRPGPVPIATDFVLAQFDRRLRRARRAYLRFVSDGLADGHQAQYYATVDQRFLGDDRFVQDLRRQLAAQYEIEPAAPSVDFDRLLQAVARAHRVTPADLARPTRTRALVPARAMLVYLAKEWGGLSGRALSRHLHRDPAMITRLYAAYATARDRRREAQLARAVRA